MKSSALSLLALAAVGGVKAQYANVQEPGMDFYNDKDLETYVSRPDLRPPKFHVTVHDAKSISPGYWFVAPYDDLIDREPTRLYQPDQVGPHIYDNDGNLVWSGAHLSRGRNVFDLKPSSNGENTDLTYVLGQNKHDSHDVGGVGIVLDNHYRVRDKVKVRSGLGTINMHEFSTVHNGTRALMFMHETKLWMEPHPDGREFEGWIIDLGFVEVDVKTGKKVFEWWAAEHFHPLDSTVGMPRLPGNMMGAWDYFHINSLDKTPNGDYLISARHCNTILLVSGRDGSVIWRLGGVDSASSSFIGTGTDFSSQHDARFHSSNATHTVITFLNNASDNFKKTATYTKALMVALATNVYPMTATIIGSWDRPDLRLTHLRGNVQVLPNENVWVCWSANSYISEFLPDGRCLLEAWFESTRFASYRAYKANFTADPEEDPVVKSFVYGTDKKSMMSVSYVSWNGATEAVAWNFYASTRWSGEFKYVGSTAKTGFETVYMHGGFAWEVIAEAVAADGTRLRNSTVTKTILPVGYQHVVCSGRDCDSLGNDRPIPVAPGALPAPNGEGAAGRVLSLSGVDLEAYRMMVTEDAWSSGGLFVAVFTAGMLSVYSGFVGGVVRRVRGLARRVGKKTAGEEGARHTD